MVLWASASASRDHVTKGSLATIVMLAYLTVEFLIPRVISVPPVSSSTTLKRIYIVFYIKFDLLLGVLVVAGIEVMVYLVASQ